MLSRWRESRPKYGASHRQRAELALEQNPRKALEGGHGIRPGDVIVTGITGRLYPCRPEIFEATDEPV